MVKLWTVNDLEYAHREADEILCEALEMHGETALVTAWKAVRKWYT